MEKTLTYDSLVKKMREFFLQKGFVEVPTQSRLSILAACENPHSITTYNYSGEVWPLPQTGQMWLEHELLRNPEWPGCFCISTSYRQEKDPMPIINNAYITHDCEKGMCKFADYLVVSQLSGELPNKVEAEKS